LIKLGLLRCAWVNTILKRLHSPSVTYLDENVKYEILSNKLSGIDCHRYILAQ